MRPISTEGFEKPKSAAEPLSAELFREAVAVAAEEAKRDGKDVSRLQVSRIYAIVDDLKKNAFRRGIPDQNRK
jgi:hypothetical protein